METNDTSNEKRTERSLLLTMGIVVAVVAVIAIIGFIFMNKPDDMIEGQVEGTTVRISGKLPGRVVEIFVQEGDTVHAGDTLVHVHSALADAQLTQAEAMEEVAKAQNRKVDAGTRSQIIQAAYDLMMQAKSAVTITEKTYKRLENLYKEGYLTEHVKTAKGKEYTITYEAVSGGTAKAVVVTAPSVP